MLTICNFPEFTIPLPFFTAHHLLRKCNFADISKPAKSNDTIYNEANVKIHINFAGLLY